jgi:signal transduction histidine kinase
MPPDLTSQVSLLGLFCTLGLGLMGLWLPKPKTRMFTKVFYTALEFGLVLLPITVDQLNRASPCLLVIVVVRSCQMFRPLGYSIVAGLAYATFLLAMLQESRLLGQVIQSVEAHTESGFSSNTIPLLQFNVSVSFGLMLIAIMLLVNSLLSEHQSRKQLAIAHEQLRQYALRIENQATLQERNRIAREIHDSLGHALTAQSIQLENAIVFCPPEAEKTQSFLMQSKSLCSKALQEVRQSVATLRSDSLSGQTLEQAIDVTVNEFEQISAIQPKCLISLSQPLTSEVSAVVHRIIQEALMNVHKHSAATEVEVHLQQQDHILMVIVRDNGAGFEPEQNRTGFGIQGMRERTLTLKGKFSLNSQPGNGCEVVAQIPLLQQ